MKDKTLIIGVLIIALVVSLISGAFLISDSKRISFLEGKLNNSENYNFVTLQPSYYFSAEEYPNGKIEINMTEKDLTLSRASATISMLPTIPRNALLFEIPIVESELVIGDIVSIHTKDYDIVHRLVNITDEGYITKGDNNNVVDSEVWQIDDLAGKIVGVLW